jgi:hypothetical protein
MLLGPVAILDDSGQTRAVGGFDDGLTVCAIQSESHKPRPM